ncbi:UbiD family decarboxylase [Oceanicoccus sagamiensis]|uniref:UbiD family decarboxylase n=1 Tax=Oceanicoccus sagamiensis TaxID=716816 RepID=A0A1X9NEN8_9GAMM|nr:UbiD family decarboxylase [Oceanicoccus sagamiensis]ARN73407.1 hypothetical protein BST96_04340 [Oceanicoccus sagamiensis]
MSEKESINTDVSRRSFLTATGVAALAAAGCAPLSEGMSNGTPVAPKRDAQAIANAPKAPFDSFRDWIAALDAHGLLYRIPEIDQDAYHATALFYRATDKFSMYGAPAFMFDRIKIDGEWVEGPMFANHQGHWITDCLIWGLDPIENDNYASYRKARGYLEKMLADNNGEYPMIPPREIEASAAPCKEIVLTGDDIDITKFAFFKTNPGDGGRYVNTGSVFMDDPKMGPNYGTYRNEIKGPRKLVMNPEPNQTGHRMIMAARKRGDKVLKLSIVVGQDPVIWMISGSKIKNRFTTKDPIYELDIAGGMRGKAIDIVKSETNDLMIPAHAEMVIEGEIVLDGPMEPEGPFGEMFGYMGPAKSENFVINITTITHRKNPWLMNAFTGMQRGMVTAPADALYATSLKKKIPNIVEYTNPHDTMGMVVLSIDKQEAGEGIKSGMSIAKTNPIAKVVVVVDKDINILDHREVMFAIGSRWQPHPASKILERAFGLQTDPSQVKRNRTSKIVIDATRQLPDEGGREAFPMSNREHLAEGAPNAFAEVEQLLVPDLFEWDQI